MNASDIPIWTEPVDSGFVIAHVEITPGVFRFRRVSKSLIGATGPKGADGVSGTSGTNGTNGANGANGATGPQGPQGPAGTNGTATQWRDGSGVPSNSLGVDGDYYLDDTTGNVYKKASGTYSIVGNIKGANGSTGAQGPAGTSSHSVLTYSATTNIDFSQTDDYRTVSLTGNITFTTSNRAVLGVKILRIIADGSIRNLTFPGTWVWECPVPASIAANKTAILSLTCYGTNDSDVVAAYSVQP